MLTEVGSGLGLFLSAGYKRIETSDKVYAVSKTSDPRERFFVDKIEYRPGEKVRASELYLAFCHWCEREGIASDVTITTFGKWVVEQINIQKTKVGGYIHYLGIRLK